MKTTEEIIADINAEVNKALDDFIDKPFEPQETARRMVDSMKLFLLDRTEGNGGPVQIHIGWDPNNPSMVTTTAKNLFTLLLMYGIYIPAHIVGEATEWETDFGRVICKHYPTVPGDPGMPDLVTEYWTNSIIPKQPLKRFVYDGPPITLD